MILPNSHFATARIYTLSGLRWSLASQSARLTQPRGRSNSVIQSAMSGDHGRWRWLRGNGEWWRQVTPPAVGIGSYRLKPVANPGCWKKLNSLLRLPSLHRNRTGSFLRWTAFDWSAIRAVTELLFQVRSEISLRFSWSGALFLYDSSVNFCTLRL